MLRNKIFGEASKNVLLRPHNALGRHQRESLIYRRLIGQGRHIETKRAFRRAVASSGRTHQHCLFVWNKQSIKLTQ